MNNTIEIIRGTSNAFGITVTDADSNLYSLLDGEKLVFGVKRKPTDVEYLILKTATSGENGVYVINITPDDTEHLVFGDYWYDVGLQSGSNYYNVIEPSRFKVCPNVTKWGDGS